MLLYHDGSFMQVLEGAPTDVEAVFGRILYDPHHRDIHQVLETEVDRRRFGRWSMGFIEPSRIADEEALACREEFENLAAHFKDLDAHPFVHVMLSSFVRGARL